MPQTDFYASQPYNKDAWGHKAYDEFMANFFFTGMLGSGEEAIIDHITELTKNNKGEAGAWLHLVADIQGGGVVGDNTLEGRLRALEASWIRCNFDQLRNGMETKGRMSEQKSVINARKQFRKKLARFFALAYEEQAVLTASGISYAFNTDGSPRVTPPGQDAWVDLLYAADVTAPTANRHVRWVGASNTFVAGNTASVVVGDVMKYEMLPDLEALGTMRNLTPLKIDGEEFFVWMIHTNALAALWKDINFRNNVVNGETRGSKNPIFKGTKVTMNNIIIKPYKRTYSTIGAAAGSKWGGAGTVNGSRSLLLGAQALAMVDIGPINWEEEHYDFNARWALAGDKMAGYLKPKFLDSYTGTVEDFGVIAVDHAFAT